MKTFLPISLLLLLAPNVGFSQSDLGAQLAQIASLAMKVRDASTNVRVDAFHTVWMIASSSRHQEVKMAALELITEPAGSASDHIRIPAIYAAADIADSTDALAVKEKALTVLRGPIQAAQVPIRDVAIDAVNSIVASAKSIELSMEALKLLSEPVKSGNNGVRIPAINSIIRAAESVSSERVSNAAIDLLVAPLDSGSMIGGMEVRLMAVVGVEKLGLHSSDVATKAKAAGLLRSYAGKSSWEPEAKKRAEQAASRIEGSMNRPAPAQPASDRSKV